MDKLPIEIRPGMESDANFILSSWLKSYRQSYFARVMTNTIYFDNHHSVLRRILKRATVLVASNVDSPDQIYGYIVFEMVDGIPVIHYTYVKHTFRGMNIAKLLYNQAKGAQEAAVYTHHTRVVESLSRNYNLVHHPYLAFELPKESE